MAQQALPYTIPDITNNEAWKRTGEMFSDIFSRLSRTISVGENRFSSGSSTEAKANLAITQALAELAFYVEFPAFMLGYDITQIDPTILAAFHAAGGRLTREGGRPDVFDLRAYGGIGSGTANDAPSTIAAVGGIPSGGGTIHVPPDFIFGIGAQVDLPTDRLIVFSSDGGSYASNQFLTVRGAQFKRLSSYTNGPLFSQATAGAPIHGVQMYNIVLNSNDLAGDLLALTHCHEVVLDNCSFFNGNGHGVAMTGVFNSRISNCRFLELGSTTGPNYALYLTADSVAAVNGLWMTDNQFECGRGTYIRAIDPTGTHPIDQVHIRGGKFEFSGNNHGTTPGVPLVNIDNAQHWTVNADFVNGMSNGATHIRINGSSRMKLDTVHIVTSTTDALNPKYLIQVNTGDRMTVKGIYKGGGGASGAQIRVTQGGGQMVYMDKTNVHMGSLSGVDVVVDAGVDNLGTLQAHQGEAGAAVVTLTDAATIATNCSRSNAYKVTVAAARTVGAPTNPTNGQECSWTIVQDGTGGWAITWNAVFKQAWSDTGNSANKRSTIAFIYDGTNWNQKSTQSPYV
jgi:hypothetical protein